MLTKTPEDFAAAEWASEEEREAYMLALMTSGKAVSRMDGEGRLHFVDPLDFWRKPEETEEPPPC